MKVAELVELMTKAYLHRIIDSFTKDFPKPDEERSREIIVGNAEELTDPARIRSALAKEQLYSEQILQAYILDALVNRPDYLASEEEVVQEVRDLERATLEEAQDSEALRYEDPHAVEIFRSVLAVALEDQTVSEEELNLIRRLREKLGIHERTKRILLAKLNHFPRQGNRIHTPSDCREALIDLQKRGVVFYCNRLNGGRYVLPEEIVPGVKRSLGIEMNRKGWEKLLQALTKEQLATILETAGLPKSGAKAEQVGRIKAAGLQPGECLESLTYQDLYAILSGLPGAKVGGSKDTKIARVVEYFDKLIYREVPSDAPPGELYYQYIVELAARDREILLANGVIKKDREMDSAFELATSYLFGEKLGLSVVDLPGSDCPDGCVEMGRHGELLMWDNKSKESVYTFPPSHRRQFKRYIRDSAKRVSCFLIITPAIDGSAAQAAARLKVECGTDTDVALISAEDLFWLSKHWDSQSNSAALNPEVFNITGILDRSMLEQRMRLFR